MSTRLSIIVTALLALVAAGCITISLFPQAMPLREKTVQGTAADKILMMDISGVISEKGSSNPLSESEDLVARIKEELTLAAEDSHIKRSEEHTSELQSPCNIVCRLLLEKKK